jgi:hypothetical protein
MNQVYEGCTCFTHVRQICEEPYCHTFWIGVIALFELVLPGWNCDIFRISVEKKMWVSHYQFHGLASIHNDELFQNYFKYFKKTPHQRLFSTGHVSSIIAFCSPVMDALTSAQLLLRPLYCKAPK